MRNRIAAITLGLGLAIAIASGCGPASTDDGGVRARGNASRGPEVGESKRAAPSAGLSPAEIEAARTLGPLPAPPPPPPWSDAWMLGETTRYLDDPSFRRDILERSLTNPENLYSAARLSAYGSHHGWSLLPTWVPWAAPVDDGVVEALRRGERPALPDDASPLWDGTRPTTMEGWVALGRRVFFEYPLRPEVFAEHALTHPEIAARTGLVATPEGTWPGLVTFRDIDQRVRVGITCALCHTTVEDGEIVIGRARRDFDYGQLRLAWHQDTGEPLPAELAERMASWGPGRADITEDDDEDPVSIPDLWGVREQTSLTQAATIQHVHPAALAIRQETQILHANRERSRPPRELAWALAMFVYAIEPPPRDASHVAAAADPSARRGMALFERHCRSCHDNGAYGGNAVPAEDIGTERTLAFGRARGTELYRPSPLVRVGRAAPYLHDGSVASLEDLLGTERFDPTYDRGVHRPGPVPGHRFGTELPQDDRHALVTYLRTL